MRKMLISLFAFLFLVTGCSKLDNSKEQDSLVKYESYLSTIVEHDRYVEASNNYDVYAIVNKLRDGSTRYDVIIENPKIAMYNIQALVVENSAKKSDEIIYPSIGIFDEENYSFIPNQSNENKGYIEAIRLSGVSKNDPLVLNVLVVWTDRAKTITNREFIKLFPSFEKDEPIVNEEEENTEEVNEENEENIEEEKSDEQ